MGNIDHYMLTLDLGKVEKVKDGWDSDLSASRNLGKALQKRIKSIVAPEYLEKVNISLSGNDVEDFIPSNIKSYVTSRKGTMAYLAALNPTKVVLVNTQLVTSPGEKPDLVILSLGKEAPDGDYPSWEKMMGKIGETAHPHSPTPYSYDDILKIRHIKITATAHLKPGKYGFSRDLPEWGLNFTFSGAVLRLCNLSPAMHFTITKMPGTAFRWLPEIDSGGDSALPVLKGDTYEIDADEDVEMRYYGHNLGLDILYLERRFALRSAHFAKKDGAYQTTAPLTCGEEEMGSLELNFIDAEE